MKRPSLLLALLVALTGLTVPAAYAEDPAPVVTWPEVTAFNPAETPYPITVEDTGAGPLYLRHADSWFELPHQGEYVVPFQTDDHGSTQLTVWRCTSAGVDCVATGVRSPLLQLVSRASVEPKPTYWEHPLGPRTGDQNHMVVGVSPDLTDVTVTWQLVDQRREPWTVLASGVHQAAGVSRAGVDVAFEIPEDAGTGRRFLVFTMSGESDTYGHLDGASAPFQIVVDAEPPAAQLRVGDHVVYPVDDDYRDSVRVVPDSGPDSAVMEIIDPAGHVFGRVDVSDIGSADRLTFSGLDEDGRLLPEGVYELRLTATDEAFNVAVATEHVRVSHERLVTRTFSRTVTARASLVDKYVGDCSTLRAPASRGWVGSLGLYSQTSCTRSKQSAVITRHGMYVPRAVDRRYGRLQVSTFGGRAEGQQDAYLVFGFVSRSDDFIGRVQHSGALRAHRASTTRPVVQHDRDGRPYVLWQVGLTDGSRYDVRDFTVKLRYQVLR